MRQTYLSDGVYAAVDKTNTTYPVILTTGSHNPEAADNVVYLERAALMLLVYLCVDEGIIAIPGEVLQEVSAAIASRDPKPGDPVGAE